MILKKAVYASIVLAMFAVGCSPYKGTGMLLYTQTSVCDGRIDCEKYDFFQNAQDSGIIVPALEQNFIPQGIAYWEEQNRLLISGYFKPNPRSSSARILTVDANTGEFVGVYSLVDRYGRSIGSHFSGLAVTESNLFVVEEQNLFCVSLEELQRAGKSGTLRVSDICMLDVVGGTCNYANDILWICEHYQEDDYPLRGAHDVKGKDGTVFHAWMVGYRISDSGDLRPYRAFAVPDKIQGISVLEDGRIILSSSYGRKNPSKLLIYNDPGENPPDGYVEIWGAKTPIWCLDSANGIMEYTAPPMSEGCCLVNDRLYLIFESGAYYYRAYETNHVAVDPTDKIWVLDLPKK